MTENPYAAPEYVPESAEMTAEVPEMVLTRVSFREVVRAVDRRVLSLTLLKAVAGIAAIVAVTAVIMAVCLMPLVLSLALAVLAGSSGEAVSEALLPLFVVLFFAEAFLVLPAVVLWGLTWLLRYFDALLHGENWQSALWQTARQNRHRTLLMAKFALLYGALPCGVWAGIVVGFWEVVLGMRMSQPVEIFVIVPMYVWLVLLTPGLWLTAVHGVPCVQAGKMTLRMVRMNFRTFALLAIYVAAMLGVAALWAISVCYILGVTDMGDVSVYMGGGEIVSGASTIQLTTLGVVLVNAAWVPAGLYILFFYPIFCMMACGEKLGMRSEE